MQKIKKSESESFPEDDECDVETPDVCDSLRLQNNPFLSYHNAMCNVAQCGAKYVGNRRVTRDDF